MENAGGMVAIVQGLRDSGLTVTLLDGARQYTLTPEAPQSPPPQLRSNPSVNSTSRHQQCDNENGGPLCQVRKQRDNGVQATDGRYASTYKMMHCNVRPTSPAQDVTEFPPQRPDVLPGHGNFVVGGYGSGETCAPTIKSNSFRGAMRWPDRGSVCVSKPSVQPDSFANSLRKYPSISPDRSTELVERLISFTQAKNISRTHRNNFSPPHETISSESSKQAYYVDRNSNNPTKAYRDIKTTRHNRTNDNSPVRERSRNELEESVYRRYCKNDVKCFRQDSRRDSDGTRNMSSDQFPKSSSPRRREHDLDQKRTLEQTSNNSVNMEIQVSTQMESKEILTLPRIVPMQRTIGTSLSPVPSNIDARINSDDKPYAKLHQKCSCKSIQVSMPKKHVKTTSSSMDIDQNKVISNKRSRSDAEIGSTKKNLKNVIVRLLQHLNSESKDAIDIQDIEPRSKRNKEGRDHKPLLTKYESLRRTLSDNMCSNEDFLNSERETSKHTYAILKDHVKVHTYDLDDKVTNEEQALQEYVDRLNCRSSNISMFSAVGNVDDALKSSHKTYTDNDPRDYFVARNKLPLNRICGHCHKNHKKYKDFVTNKERSRKEPRAISIQELRNLIDLDVLAFTEKHSLNISTESLYDLRDELIDIILMDGKYMSSINQNCIRKNVKNVLENGGFTEFYSVSLTKILTDHWEEQFSINKLNLQPSIIKSDTFIVLPNININSSKYVQSDGNAKQETDFSINEISQKDIDANVNTYSSKISDEVNDWVANIDLPQAQDEELRQAITTYLTNEVVDRQKYLELNPTTEVSDASELEYLKYQIFKCMHKLIGDVDMSAVENAQELRNRIQTVPVPIFTIKQRRLSIDKGSNHKIDYGPFPQMVNVIESSNVGASSTKRLSSPVRCCKRDTCKRNIDASRRYSLREPEYAQEVPTSTRRLSSPEKLRSNEDDSEQRPSSIYELHRKPVTNTERQQRSAGTDSGTSSGHFSGGIKIRDDEDDTHNLPLRRDDKVKDDLSNKYEINESYVQYLKDWVDKIPIPVNDAEDEAMAEKARNDIFSSVLDTVSKLKSGPQMFENNRFILEDKLDDEIETLLRNLPQSPELEARKHILKVKLIEKTIETNDLLKHTPTKSYKQQLVESVRGEISEQEGNDNQDPELLKLYEDLQILNLVEDFIILSRYHNEDNVSSEAYRKKLLKNTEKFVEELKANHRKALKDIDPNSYVDSIIETLKKVPLPSNDTVQEEADEILLGNEIEKWLSHLPLIPQDDYVGQLLKRRLRNNLTKKILDKEKGVLTDSALDDTLKHEVSQFLGKTPLQEGEILNINLMVEDLINRIKNRRKSSQESDGKKVGFHETNYDEFSRNMPHCSSYTEYPKYSSNINVGNRNETPAEQTFSGNYSVAKPLFDDLSLDRKCCEPDTPLKDLQAQTTNDLPRPSFKDTMEPHWYTLQESAQEPPESGRQSSRFLRHSVDNRTYYPEDNPEDHDVRPEHMDEFVVPRKFIADQTSNELADDKHFTQIDHNTSPRKISANRSPLSNSRLNQNNGRDLIIDRRLPHAPTSPRRREVFEIERDSNESSQRANAPTHHRETERYDRYDYSPNRNDFRNRSDIFHKSTDREGRRQTIERNRNMEKSSSFYHPGYPTRMPPGYVPVRMEKRPHMRRHHEDSEEEEEEVRCRCMEKFWRKNRRPRYCPLDDNDYPLCFPPYFYPYYY